VPLIKFSSPTSSFPVSFFSPCRDGLSGTPSGEPPCFSLFFVPPLRLNVLLAMLRTQTPSHIPLPFVPTCQPFALQMPNRPMLCFLSFFLILPLSSFPCQPTNACRTVQGTVSGPVFTLLTPGLQGQRMSPYFLPPSVIHALMSGNRPDPFLFGLFFRLFFPCFQTLHEATSTSREHSFPFPLLSLCCCFLREIFTISVSPASTLPEIPPFYLILMNKN